MRILPCLLIMGLLIAMVVYANVRAEDHIASEVAKTISAESCGEGPTGLWAVANVVANRARKHNKTPYQVITKPRQFKGYSSPHKERLYSECKESSDFMANHLMKLPDITFGATHFVNLNHSKPKWIYSLKKTIKIGNHTFYKEDR